MKFEYIYSTETERVKIVEVQCYNELEYNALLKFLTYTEKVAIMKRGWDKVTRQVKYRPEFEMKNFVACMDHHPKQLKFTVGYGLSLIIRDWLESKGYKYHTQNDPIEQFEPIRFLDKWINIYKTHPKPEKGIIQLNAAKALSNKDCGIISLGVGGGKTELILGIVESYLTQFPDKNAMIITFSSKVLDELKLRAEQYNINSDRLMFIQPNGYMRRKNALSDEFLEFVKNCELLVSDEAHHYTAQSWKDLHNLINPKYTYAFTGSADSNSGEELTWEILNSDKMTTQILDLINLCGQMVIHAELQVPVKVTVIKDAFTDKKEYQKYKLENPTTLGKLTQFTLRHPRLIELIKYAIDNYIPEDALIFIPELTAIETGVHLSDELNKLGIPTVYYSAQYVNSPVGKIELSLKELKELAKNKQFKVLISNIVGIEGIDLANLSAIIPISGVSFKSIIQPIGRSARGDLVHCVFIFDENNRMYTRQNTHRYDTVKEKLNVISETVIDLRSK